jgi:peptidoglycan/xylan/chitin deacetylase (PgdA/CDA1 family)
LTLLILCFTVALAPATPAHAGFTVYLTFDDGPYPGHTEKILDVLKKYGVKGTFFVNGGHIARGSITYPVMKRIVQEGHKLGNHNWAHLDSLMYQAKPPMTKVIEGYGSTEAQIQAALGPDLWNQYNSQPHIYRWPGGSIWPIALPNVYSYNWNVSSGSAPSVAQAINNVLYGVPAQHTYGVYAWGDGAIILFHDQHSATPLALPKIITELRKHGATFGTLPRPGDTPGVLIVPLDPLPPCAHRQDNCAKENSP